MLLEIATNRARAGLRQPVALLRQHADQLVPAAQHVAQGLGRGIGHQPTGRAHLRREAGQQRRVEPVGLGQVAGGLGEVAHLARIDHDDRQPGRGEGDGDGALIPARRFEHDQRGGERGEGGDEGGMPRVVIRGRRRARRRSGDASAVPSSVATSSVALATSIPMKRGMAVSRREARRARGPTLQAAGCAGADFRDAPWQLSGLRGRTRAAPRLSDGLGPTG